MKQSRLGNYIYTHFPTSTLQVQPIRIKLWATCYARMESLVVVVLLTNSVSNFYHKSQVIITAKRLASSRTDNIRVAEEKEENSSNHWMNVHLNVN